MFSEPGEAGSLANAAGLPDGRRPRKVGMRRSERLFPLGKGGSKMKTRFVLSGLLLFCVIVVAAPVPAQAQTKDEQAIKELEGRFAAAFKAKDIDGIMKCYLPDESLIVFDAVPPREYVGAKAYRKDFEEFFAPFPGPAEFEMTGLSVTTNGQLGFSHGIQHCVLTDKDGKKQEFTVRVTDCYRKVNGKWLIVHEHVSWPADPETGKADFTSKP
jgi:uncharacterized protein (TIGR02246 family)